MGSTLANNPWISRLNRCLIPAAITTVGMVFLNVVHDESAPYGATNDISSAAFFPGLIALLVSALGIALLISGWRGQSAPEAEEAEQGTPENARAWSAYGLIVGLSVGLPWLGIWLTAMLGVPLLAAWFGERRWWLLAILAFVPALLVIHLFEGFMGIYFPRGVLL